MLRNKIRKCRIRKRSSLRRSRLSKYYTYFTLGSFIMAKFFCEYCGVYLS